MSLTFFRPPCLTNQNRLIVKLICFHRIWMEFSTVAKSNIEWVSNGFNNFLTHQLIPRIFIFVSGHVPKCRLCDQDNWYLVKLPFLCAKAYMLKELVCSVFLSTRTWLLNASTPLGLIDMVHPVCLKKKKQYFHPLYELVCYSRTEWRTDRQTDLQSDM